MPLVRVHGQALDADADDRHWIQTTHGKYRSLSKRPSTAQIQYMGQSSGAQPKDRAHVSNTSGMGG